MTTPIHFTSADRPSDAELVEWRKTQTTMLQWVDQPFAVTTQEGTTHLVDDTNENWEDGYWVSWPTDGSEPYPISPQFVRDNYEQVQPR